MGAALLVALASGLGPVHPLPSSGGGSAPRSDVVFHTDPGGAAIYRISSKPGPGDFLGYSGQTLRLDKLPGAGFYVRLELTGYESQETVVSSEVWERGRWPLTGTIELRATHWKARILRAWHRYGLPVTALVGLAGLWTAALMRRRKAQLEVLRAHLPQTVLHSLLQQDEGERPMTMLVSDIANFSTHCERLSATEVAGRLDHHYREMTEIISAHQGEIAHFVGDQFVVLFHGPGHPQRGLSTAQAMLLRLEQLRRLDPQEVQGFYHVRIGIHSGLMAIESRQATTKVDYTVVGPDSQDAYQVQEETKDHGVSLLISAATARELRNQPGLTLVARGDRFEPGGQG